MKRIAQRLAFVAMWVAIWGTRAWGAEIVVRVADKETDAAVANAQINVRVGRERYDLPTGDDGTCRVPYDEARTKYIYLTAKADGYVPMRVYWRGRNEPAEPPKTFTFKMPKAGAIGGVVKNEHGEAVDNVRVRVYVYGSNREGQASVYLSGFSVSTDPAGAWRCDWAPKNPKNVRLKFTHPEYSELSSYVSNQGLLAKKLQELKWVAVLKTGANITGKVVDEDGWGIAGAQVRTGRDYYSSGRMQAKTGPEGDFEIRHAPEGATVLTVTADGYAPELKPVTVKAGMEPIEFRLPEGQAIRGQVLDAEGKPVPGVSVSTEGWRGYRTIRWRGRTDADGWFEWNSAPADGVAFSFYKSGFMSMRNKVLTPHDDVHVMVMNKALIVSGMVTDADTGQPVARFKVVQGLRFKQNKTTNWQRQNPATGRDGRYTTTFTYPYDGHVVRIEAKGYLPAESRVFTSSEGEQTFDFKLKKGNGPKGVVVGTDGQPLAGARIAVALPGQYLQVNNGELSDSRRYGFDVVTTDAEGRFQMQPQTGKFALLVVHEQGMIEVKGEDLAKTPTLALKPWGRIEGVARIGAKPAANQRVNMWASRPYRRNEPRINFYYSTHTDDEGKFAFKRVSPGEWYVGRMIRIGANMSTTTHSTFCEVKPGQTATVAIGGTGRPVVGRVAAPKGKTLRLAEWRTQGNVTGIPTSQPAAELFRTLGKLLAEGKTPPPRRVNTSYAVVLQDDGSFRIEDVPAGSYRMNISFRERGLQQYGGWGAMVGTAQHNFVVPPMPGGRSDEPLNLGRIEATLYPRLNVGDTAPDFEVQTLDGVPFKLADHRGSVVLLNFWATWQKGRPDQDVEAELKAVYDVFGEPGRIVMLGINVDPNANVAKTYVAENQIPWAQAHQRAAADSKMLVDYGVLTPRGGQMGLGTYLIGPDGKVLGARLKKYEIQAAIEKALAGGGE